MSDFEFRKEPVIIFLKQCSFEETLWVMGAVLDRLKREVGKDAYFACLDALLSKRTFDELVDMKEAVNTKLKAKAREDYKRADEAEKREISELERMWQK